MRISNRISTFVGLCVLCSACADPDLELDELSEDADAGDEAFRVQWGGIFDHFEFVQEDTRVAHATGSVQDPMRNHWGTPLKLNGYPRRTTCGITFISPHYAVTAGHCVDRVTQPQTQPLRVETYDISSIDLFALWASTAIEGVYPSFERLAPVESFAGYDVAGYDCYVRARCQEKPYNCSINADIALLHCPGRAANAAWVPVAQNDTIPAAVEMYWPHEVLSIPTSEPQPPSSSASEGQWDSYEQQLELYEHYTVYNGAALHDNHHYLGGDANALLPLKSVDWPGGEPRQSLYGIDSVGNRISTDLFGCHGTSGSGVFRRNAQGQHELLGPVATGALSWVVDRLCNDPDAAVPNEIGLTYTSNASTRALQSAWSTTLYMDRFGATVPVPPTPPIAPPWW